MEGERVCESFSMSAGLCSLESGLLQMLDANSGLGQDAFRERRGMPVVIWAFSLQAGAVGWKVFDPSA